MAYAVWVVTEGEKPDSKVFQKRGAARSFADQKIDAGADQAIIYDLPNIDDPGKALAALKMGEGLAIECRGKKASAQQILDAEFREMFDEDGKPSPGLR